MPSNNPKEKEFDHSKLVIDELFKRSIEFQGTEEFVRFFTFISGFHHYSGYNCMLVYIQNKNITYFGGSYYWKKHFNRTVNDDAKAYVILQPFSPVMLVYDVFDTEGKLSPEEFLRNQLGHLPFETTGIFDDRRLFDLINKISDWGIKLKFDDFTFTKAGHIAHFKAGATEIVVKKSLKPVEAFSTIIHELGHLLMGHTKTPELKHLSNDSKTLKLLIRRPSKEVRELEAETINFLICKRLGLETRSAEYLSSYISDPEILKDFSYELVVKMADKIEEMFVR